MSFHLRIFFSVFIGALIALAIPLIYVALTVQDSLLEEARTDSLRAVRFIFDIMDALPNEKSRQEFLRKFDTEQTQIAFFSSNGMPIIDKNTMFRPLKFHDITPNPEIHDAISQGQGFDVRYSEQLQTDVLYAAIPLPDDGHILRFATPFSEFLPRKSFLTTTFFLIVTSSLPLALIVAYFLSNLLRRDLTKMMQVITAISLGNYSQRLHIFPGKDFTPLVDAVNRMATDISHHVDTITTQKEQLQTILDTMNDGVLVLDKHAIIRSSNNALQSMFPAMKHAVGLQLSTVLHHPLLHQAIQELLQQSAPKKTYTTEDTPAVVRPPLHLELAPGSFCTIYLTYAGNTDMRVGAVAVFHDISPIMQLERKRRDFVANASHELRTPLTAIQGYAETLAKIKDVPPDFNRFAKKIYKNSTYLAQMVEEILHISQIENTDLPIQLTTIRALDAVQAAITLCKKQFKDKNIHLEIRLSKDIMLKASMQHLTQVFRNLLENAVRYAPENSSICISTHEDDIPRHMICFAVCDSGSGIAQTEQHRIFERFYRIEKYRDETSTGLGLAICRQIIERFGGRIWVKSPAGKYSTAFYFTIPTALEIPNDSTKQANRK